MLEVEVALPPLTKILEVEKLIETACAAEGLRPTLKGTLAGYPGSIHWHFKKGKLRGTLEVALWKTKRRLWFAVQAGRTGAWMEEALPRLKHQLERNLTPMT